MSLLLASRSSPLSFSTSAPYVVLRSTSALFPDLAAAHNQTTTSINKSSRLLNSKTLSLPAGTLEHRRETLWEGVGKDPLSTMQTLSRIPKRRTLLLRSPLHRSPYHYTGCSGSPLYGSPRTTLPVPSMRVPFSWRSAKH